MSSDAFDSIEYKPLIFVTGKGGVGKTTLAAAIALGLSKQGRRVLLVELGESATLGKFFQTPEVGFEPTEVAQNLKLALWDYLSCLKEYVGFYIKVSSIVDLFFSNPIVQKFLQAAPTLKELALLGKATSQPRKVGPALDFDHIVIDSYSTGHHRALLRAPFGMSTVIQKGPMGHHSRKMAEVLQNSKYTQHFIVFKPEEMPITEALELRLQLKEEFQLDVELICNQIMDFPKTEENKTHELDRYIHTQAESQEKLLSLLEKTPYLSVKYHFEKKDKLNFLNQIFQNLRKGRS